jgi:hypothetical protein
MRHIATYFDENFLPRGLALYDSIVNNSDDFILYILALDEYTKEYFTKLAKDNIVVIGVHEYITYYNIDKTKYSTDKEFYFSVTPSLCLYVIENFKDIDILLYLDADVYLFNDLEILYNEIGDSSISMCSHRIAWYLDVFSKNYGKYNVGVNAFRNDGEGIKCLKQWYKDCSTWKPHQKDYPLSFFSDQIWLDKWQGLYKNIKIIEHIGINVAPWNAIQYKFTKNNNRYYVNNTPLVIYHFSSLKELDNNLWHGNTGYAFHNISGLLLEVYKKYILNIVKYGNDKNTQMVQLSFSGSFLKKIVYRIIKNFHNHIINIKEKI